MVFGSRTFTVPALTLCRAEYLLVQSERREEMTDLHDLVFGQIASPRRSEGDGLAVDGHGPIASMCLMNLAKPPEQRTHVVPLNVVTKRVTEQFLSGNSVVMVQLD